MEQSPEKSSTPESAKEYVIREAYSSHLKNQEKIAKKMDELEDKWSLPSWLTYVRVISVALGAMLIACAVMIVIGVGFASAFSRGWFVAGLIVGVIFFAFGLTCFIVEYARKKRVENSEDYKKAMKYIDDLTERSREYLGIPESKATVDVFFYPYILRDGHERDNGAFKYLNTSLYLFEEENKLCLANNNTVYGIDKSLFKRMLQNPKKVSFSVWNKDVPYGSDELKEYKINRDHYGIFHVKNVTSVIFETEDGFKREIVIPPYEVHHFEKILGIKILEKEDEE